MIRYLNILLFLASFTALSQSTFQDQRDGEQYEIVKLGDLYWMSQDLRFSAEESKCVGDCKGSKFYSFEQLEGICPEGWRLPVVSEWDFFVTSFEGAKTARMMEGNEKLYRIDFLDQYNLFESNLLQIKPLGRFEGGKFMSGNYVDYWTINPATDERFHMHLTPYSIMGHAHKHHLKTNKPEEFRLFPVRCVCESNKIED